VNAGVRLHMKVYASRGSVAAGDDVDAPHGRRFWFFGSPSLERILKKISRSGYLPSIAGGQATWSVTSNVPVAVIAEQWAEPRMISLRPDDLKRLDQEQGILKLRFDYHAQLDPDSVYRNLTGA
jgi:hypothetical protein